MPTGQGRVHGRSVSKEERQRIWKMAADGVAYKTIAAALDRPQGTVNEIISTGIAKGLVPRRYVREASKRRYPLLKEP